MSKPGPFSEKGGCTNGGAAELWTTGSGKRKNEQRLAQKKVGRVCRPCREDPNRLHEEVVRTVRGGKKKVRGEKGGKSKNKPSPRTFGLRRLQKGKAPAGKVF